MDTDGNETRALRALAERVRAVEALSSDLSAELTRSVQQYVIDRLPASLLQPTTGPSPGYGATIAGPIGARYGVRCVVHLAGIGQLGYDAVTDTWSWAWPPSSPYGHQDGLASPQDAVSGLVLHLLTEGVAGGPTYAATLMRHCGLRLAVVPAEVTP